jgi:hypothetical protein
VGGAVLRLLYSKFQKGKIEKLDKIKMKNFFAE